MDWQRKYDKLGKQEYQIDSARGVLTAMAVGGLILFIVIKLLGL